MSNVFGSAEAHMWSLVSGSGGASIKSLQRGTAAFLDATLVLNVAITAVDLTKAFVVITTTGSGGTNTVAKMAVRAALTSSTNLELSRSSAGASGSMTIEWQVVELYGSASVQQVLTTITAATTDVAITAVDMAKAFVILSWRASVAATDILTLTQVMPRALLTTATNLQIAKWSTVNSIDVATFVVQLK